MGFSYNLANFIAFRDLAECERVRAIKREEITKHANPDFKIRLIEDLGEFYGAFATDIVSRIQQSLEEGRRFVGIFPVGPMPQYAIAARMINAPGPPDASRSHLQYGRIRRPGRQHRPGRLGRVHSSRRCWTASS